MFKLRVEWDDSTEPDTHIEWDDPDSLGNLIRILLDEMKADTVRVRRDA